MSETTMMPEMEDAQKKVEEFTAEAQKTMQEGVEKVTKGFEDAAGFGQENLDAVVESGRVAAKALENINAGMIAFSKKSYEDGLAAMKEITACTSVTEAVEKQNEYAKASLDSFVAEATKMNEMFTAAAKDVFEPINARMHAAADMMKTYRA